MHWLIKSDPDDYSAEDLERDGITTWDGVKNATALIHIRKMKAGERAIIYHTGKQRAAVAIANLVSDAYVDPHDAAEKLAVVDIEFDAWLTEPVTLATIKADERFAAFPLVTMGRLSVMPVEPSIWKHLLKLAKGTR